MSDRAGLLTATDAGGTEWLIPVTLHGAYPAQATPQAAGAPIFDPLDVGVFDASGGLRPTDLKVVMG